MVNFLLLFFLMNKFQSKPNSNKFDFYQMNQMNQMNQVNNNENQLYYDTIYKHNSNQYNSDQYKYNQYSSILCNNDLQQYNYYENNIKKNNIKNNNIKKNNIKNDNVINKCMSTMMNRIKDKLMMKRYNKMINDYKYYTLLTLVSVAFIVIQMNQNNLSCCQFV